VSTTAPPASARLVQSLPNALTLSGAALGLGACAGIILQQPVLAGLAWLLAVGVDQIDGTVARMLGAQSPVGARLDTFADTVQYGIMPVMLAASWSSGLAVTGALLHALAFAWRQASGQKDHLIGLPAVIGVAAAITWGGPVPGLLVLGWGVLSAGLLISPLQVRGGPVYIGSVAGAVIALLACLVRLSGLVG